MAKENRMVTRKVKSNRQADASPLLPMNEKQEDYIKAINQHPIVICTGVWGSSKTYIPTVMAADMLRTGDIEKIVVARPTEGKGKSVGYGKGTFEQKMTPWCAPVLETLKVRLGAGHVEAFIENGKIELLSLEFIKGRSYDDTFILVDEAEDLEPEVAKSLVGRHGVRSKTVITGDTRQQDLKRRSGLEYLLEVAAFVGIDVPLIDFDSWEYCVRSDEAKAWGMAFEEFERRK